MNKNGIIIISYLTPCAYRLSRMVTRMELFYIGNKMDQIGPLLFIYVSSYIQAKT
jgi:hypothetical protein